MTTDIYVLGAGSIGCLFSYYLKKYNNNVILITRDKKENNNCNSQENNYEKSLSVEFKYKSSEGKSIDYDIVNCLVKTPTQIALNNEKIKILLITTKSPDTLQAVQTIESSLHPQCVIILMQNGVLGTYSLLTEYFINKYLQQKFSFLPRILTGTTSNGAYRTAPLQIVHAGKGTSFIGEPTNGNYYKLYHDNYSGIDLLELINQCFSPLHELDVTVYTKDEDYIKKLLPLLQSKLVINACLNPLTALFECLNGWIVDSIQKENQNLKNMDFNEHPCSKMIKEICQEAAWVLVESEEENKKEGKEDKINHNIISFDLPITIYHLSEKAKQQAKIWEMNVIDVGKKTYLNRNSMLQDIDANRAVTEIEFLNGYLVKEASKKYQDLLLKKYPDNHIMINDNNNNNNSEKTILKVNEMLLRLIKIKSWIRSQN